MCFPGGPAGAWSMVGRTGGKFGKATAASMWKELHCPLPSASPLSFLPSGVRSSSSSSLELLQSPQSLSLPFKNLLLFQKCVIPQKSTSIDSAPITGLRWVRLLLCIIPFTLHHKLQIELLWSLLIGEKTEAQKGQIFIQGHMGSVEKPGLPYAKAEALAATGLPSRPGFLLLSHLTQLGFGDWLPRAPK